MATYTELQTLSQDATLLGRVTTAIAIAAEAIRAEDGATPNHTARTFWAKQALINPDGEARKIIWLLLAQNKALTTAQINSASDVAIQTAVDGAVAMFL